MNLHLLPRPRAFNLEFKLPPLGHDSSCDLLPLEELLPGFSARKTERSAFRAADLYPFGYKSHRPHHQFDDIRTPLTRLNHLIRFENVQALEELSASEFWTVDAEVGRAPIKV